GQRLVAASREINDAMAEHAVVRLEQALAGYRPHDYAENAASPLAGRTVLILGLAYRGGVKEAAWSSALLLHRALMARGARVLVNDPLFSDEEIEELGLIPAPLPPAEPVDACILQAAHHEY